ncbi:MAG: imidazoleglycerol-phosphate dehydratase HisB [Planctomyces sp.]|nr:imidazoleglycerol-phosphate dehydratase HisB [Planctomyces sp.]MBA4119932.1 imidazoleglycerol-phosphate dehydratase HisB [Isosphaera sp.]
MTQEHATLRQAALERATRETRIEAFVRLDGAGRADISTGVGFLDHMLTALTVHGRLDVTLRCQGDLHVDDHHTAEDCAIVLGQCIDRALGDRSGIERFGWALVPMDEALARAAVDLVTRSVCVVRLGLRRERLGELSSENVGHVIWSLVSNARCVAHVDVLRGRNDHHRAEAAFKALAVALRQAVARSGRPAADNSTKGVL